MYWEHLSKVWRSTTFHLGLWFMVLFSVSFLILGGFVYRQTLVFLEQELRGTIELELNQSRLFYLERGEEIFLSRIGNLTDLDPTGIFIVLDDACQALAGGYKRLDDDEIDSGDLHECAGHGRLGAVRTGYPARLSGSDPGVG